MFVKVNRLSIGDAVVEDRAHNVDLVPSQGILEVELDASKLLVGRFAARSRRLCDRQNARSQIGRRERFRFKQSGVGFILLGDPAQLRPIRFRTDCRFEPPASMVFRLRSKLGSAPGVAVKISHSALLRRLLHEPVLPRLASGHDCARRRQRAER